MSSATHIQDLPDSGKLVQVLVSLGTVPEVVTSNPAALAQYTRDTFNLELQSAMVKTVTLSAPRGSTTSVAVVAAGGLKSTLALPAPPERSAGIIERSKAAAAAQAAAEQQSTAHQLLLQRHGKDATGAEAAASPAAVAENLDSLSAVSNLLSLCRQQTRQILLLEHALADSREAAADDGPRTALVAERGRSLLLHAELEDVKERLRESEATVQKFAGIVSKLKDDVRLLVEMHSIGDFHGSV